MGLLARLGRLLARRAVAEPPLVEELEPRILFSADLNPAWLPGDFGAAEVRSAVEAAPAPAAAAVTEAGPLQSRRRHEIVFVDAAVADAQPIVDALLASRDAQAEVEVVHLRGDADGLSQIGEVLAGERDIDAVHIVSHGGSGRLQLGSGVVDGQTLRDRADAFAPWHSALAEGADLLLWGCDVGAGDSGEAFVDRLAQLTGADVAASVDATGSAAQGGNWTLELTRGQVQTQAPAAVDWNGLLNTYTVTNTNDNGAGSLRAAIETADGVSGPPLIKFNISGTGVHVITLTAGPLPALTERITIDATTDDSFAANGNKPAIVLNGNGWNGSGFTIGDTADGSTIRGFVIQNFGQYGIYLNPNADNNTIAGNYIGKLGASGESAGFANVNGIYVAGSGNTIGGSAAADANLIAGNNGPGITIVASNNVVRGNRIGLTLSDAHLANNGTGIIVSSGTGNALIANRIYSTNPHPAIDLGNNGPTPNDAGDTDTGANNLQNFPVLATAKSDGSQIDITGTLNSNANSYLRIDFYASAQAHPSGYGPGERWLGSVNVATDGAGNASFNTTLAAPVAVGEYVSAIATRSDASYATVTDSSEFALSIAVQAKPANVAPVNTVPGAQSVAEDTALSIAGLSITDADGNLASARLTVLHGTLAVSLAGGATISAGANNSATLTLSGNQAQINAALATLAYQGALNFNGSDTLELKSTDAGGLSDTDTVAITVSSVNDAPSGADKTVTTLEDTAYTFTAADFGFSDPNDSPANALAAVKISSLPAAGSLTLSGSAVSAGQSVSATDIGSGLLKFTPAADANGAGYASFTFQVQDNGGTANGGVDLDPSANTITVNVTPVNDPPVNTVPGPQTVPEDGLLAFTGANALSVADDGGALKNVLVSVTQGYLNANGSGGASIGFGANGAGGSKLTITGTLAQINAALATVTYAPTADWDGVDTLTLRSEDMGGLVTTSTVAITVTPVNDAPILDSAADPMLDAQYENSGAPAGAVGTLISQLVDTGGANKNVSDVDAGAQLGIAITAADLTQGSWWYSTDGGANWQALGAVANNGARLLAADAGTRLYFQPTPHFNGSLPTAITFRAWDRSSGVNGGLADTSINGGTTAFSTATDTASLWVSAVNSAPAGADKTVTTLEDSAYTFTAADFGFSDPNDSPANTLLAVKISTLPGAGALTLNGAAVNAGDSVAVADITSGKLKFTPAANANGAGYASFTFQVQDDGGTANGGVDLDPSANTITVNV
ncbi:MAG: DUF4347 domain-containing protein, partial [Rubrivivax sp.]|nr:DUF4347 domain-containing protein [Rubrivivax sp.]